MQILHVFLYVFVKIISFEKRSFDCRIEIKMSKVIGRIAINRYAKKETRKQKQGSGTSWNFLITRLYSDVEYYEREFKREEILGKQKYIYDLTKSPHPIPNSLFCHESEDFTRLHVYSCLKFYIAVKELIIEWKDYQTEASGYVHCECCSDPIYESDWFKHPTGSINEISEDEEYKFENNAKQLLRFVKSPGIRHTNIMLDKENLEFFPIDLKNCKTVSIIEDVATSCNYLQVKREHHLECEIRPLFDSEPLPIKSAHITVEIYLQ